MFAEAVAVFAEAVAVFAEAVVALSEVAAAFAEAAAAIAEAVEPQPRADCHPAALFQRAEVLPRQPVLPQQEPEALPPQVSLPQAFPELQGRTFPPTEHPSELRVRPGQATSRHARSGSRAKVCRREQPRRKEIRKVLMPPEMRTKTLMQTVTSYSKSSSVIIY